MHRVLPRSHRHVARSARHHELRQTSRVSGQWRGFIAALASVGLLLAGCNTSGEDDSVSQGMTPSSSPTGGTSASASPPASQDGAAKLIEQALAERSANRLTEFADLLSAAGKACPDPRSADRLGALAVIADRWASSLEEGRPKVQGRAEAQIRSVDWDALVATCTAS